MVRGTAASATMSDEEARIWAFVRGATTDRRNASSRLAISLWRSLGGESWGSSLEPVEVVPSKDLSIKAKGELELCG